MLCSRRAFIGQWNFIFDLKRRSIIVFSRSLKFFFRSCESFTDLSRLRIFLILMSGEFLHSQHPSIDFRRTQPIFRRICSFTSAILLVGDMMGFSCIVWIFCSDFADSLNNSCPIFRQLCCPICFFQFDDRRIVCWNFTRHEISDVFRNIFRYILNLSAI